MQKILLVIIASAVAVTMLSAFGPLAALANPSPGTPGGGGTPPGQQPPDMRTGGAHPGVPGVSGCGNPGGGTAPGNSGSQGAHAPGQGYNQGSPGQPDGSQYDVSCYQQSQHNP